MMRTFPWNTYRPSTALGPYYARPARKRDCAMFLGIVRIITLSNCQK
jgi:hypothetical protein